MRARAILCAYICKDEAVGKGEDSEEREEAWADLMEEGKVGALTVPCTSSSSSESITALRRFAHAMLLDKRENVVRPRLSGTGCKRDSSAHARDYVLFSSFTCIKYNLENACDL